MSEFDLPMASFNRGQLPARQTKVVDENHGVVEYAMMMSHPQSLVFREGVELMICMLTIHVLFVVVAVDVKLVNMLL